MATNELSKIADEARTKYTYFVLAASAAAIGYSFRLAEASKPTLALLLFALAIVSWAISFYLGCKSIQRSISVANSFADIENIDNAIEACKKFCSDREQVNVRGLYKDNLSLYSEIIKRDEGLSSRNLEAQFRFLLLGAASFVVWRTVELTYMFWAAQP